MIALPVSSKFAYIVILLDGTIESGVPLTIISPVNIFSVFISDIRPSRTV